MINIIICDDHKIIREGVKQMLSNHKEFIFSGEAETGEQLLSRLRKEKFDVVLLDISLPGRSGLDTLNEIKTNYPTLPVLILTMFHEDKYAIRMFKAGASGYLHKDSSPDQLRKAIEEVHQGNLFFTPKVSQMMVDHLKSSSSKEPHDILSDREFEILDLLGKGLGVKEIADMLSLSSKTISTHKARIMQKMKFDNWNDMMRYMIHKKLI